MCVCSRLETSRQVAYIDGLAVPKWLLLRHLPAVSESLEGMNRENYTG
jgi:hypothetical protein